MITSQLYDYFSVPLSTNENSVKLKFEKEKKLKLEKLRAEIILVCQFHGPY